MTPDEAAETLQAAERNAEVVKPFLGGEDLNSRPTGTASRWIVDFGIMTQEEATSFAEPMAWVRRRVHPYRQEMSHKPRNQKYWWRFEHPGVGLRRAIRDLDEVLVIALVGKTGDARPNPHRSGFQPRARGVRDRHEFVDQAVLSSAFHQTWAIKYGSTLETRVRYVHRSVFDTFPQRRPPTGLMRPGGCLTGSGAR